MNSLRLTEKKGIASVLVALGTLVLMVMVPLTTKLVQQNQENRSNAVARDSCRDHHDTVCGDGSNSHRNKNSVYRCDMTSNVGSPVFNYSEVEKCKTNQECKTGKCVDIPAPTLKPTATTTPKPCCANNADRCDFGTGPDGELERQCASSAKKGADGNSYKIVSGNPSCPKSGDTCYYGYKTLKNTPTATATPTKIPTPTSKPTCTSKGGVCIGGVKNCTEAEGGTVISGTDCSGTTSVCCKVTEPVGACNSTTMAKTWSSVPSDSQACSSGNVYWVDKEASDGTYNWTCRVTGGSTATCAVGKTVAGGTKVDGKCGGANGVKTTLKPDKNLCEFGVEAVWTSEVALDKFYKWNCPGVNGGETVLCKAEKYADCVCGEAINTILAIKPDKNLCKTGDLSSSGVSEYKDDSWIWACSSATCSYRVCTSLRIKAEVTPSATIVPTMVCSSTNCDLCKKDECSTNKCLWNEGSQKCLKGDNSSAQQACKGKVSGKVCVNDYLYTCISGSPQWNNGSPEKCSNGCKDGGCVEVVSVSPVVKKSCQASGGNCMNMAMCKADSGRVIENTDCLGQVCCEVKAVSINVAPTMAISVTGSGCTSKNSWWNQLWGILDSHGTKVCSSDSTGNFVEVCDNGNWKVSQRCNSKCSNGDCLKSDGVVCSSAGECSSNNCIKNRCVSSDSTCNPYGGVSGCAVSETCGKYENLYVCFAKCGSSNGKVFPDGTVESDLKDLCPESKEINNFRYNKSSAMWTWNCGNDNAYVLDSDQCSAAKKIDGVCGDIREISVKEKVPAAEKMCSAGDFSLKDSNSAFRYVWQCSGKNGGEIKECLATKVYSKIGDECNSSEECSSNKCIDKKCIAFDSECYIDGSGKSYGCVGSDNCIKTGTLDGGRTQVFKCGYEAFCNSNLVDNIFPFESITDFEGKTLCFRDKNYDHELDAVPGSLKLSQNKTEFSWQCKSSNGSIKTCKVTSTIDGECNSSKEKEYLSVKPTELDSDLCKSGSPSQISEPDGKQSYTWVCKGLGLGKDSKVCESKKILKIGESGCNGEDKRCGIDGKCLNNYCVSIKAECNPFSKKTGCLLDYEVCKEVLAGNGVYTCSYNAFCRKSLNDLSQDQKFKTVKDIKGTFGGGVTLCYLGQSYNELENGTVGAGNLDISLNSEGTRFSWKCDGKNGTSETCTMMAVLDGKCNPALSNLIFTIKPTDMEACVNGTPDWDAKGTDKEGKDGSYNWKCKGTSGVTVDCSAAKKIDGVCGKANNVDIEEEPEDNLCNYTDESETEVRLENMVYKWKCVGKNTGKTDECQAKKKKGCFYLCGMDREFVSPGSTKEAYLTDDSSLISCNLAYGSQHKLTYLCNSNGSWSSVCDSNCTGCDTKGRCAVQKSTCKWGLSSLGVEECLIKTPMKGVCASLKTKSFADENELRKQELCKIGELKSNYIKLEEESFSWTCTGFDDGKDSDTCTALKKVNGVCNPYLVGSSARNVPTEGLCSQGVAPKKVEEDIYTNVFHWTCGGKNEGSTSERCEVNKIVDGKCNENIINISPKSKGDFSGKHLCIVNEMAAIGYGLSESEISFDGTKFSWTCDGKNGGEPIACSVEASLDGVCNKSTTSRVFGDVRPTNSESCSVGEPDWSGWGTDQEGIDGTYDWKCGGVLDGKTVNCSVNRKLTNVSCSVYKTESKCVNSYNQTPCVWGSGKCYQNCTAGVSFCPNDKYCGGISNTYAYGCLDKLKENETCDSDNECLDGLNCINRKCVKKIIDSPVDPAIPAIGITLNPTTATFKVGETKAIIATVASTTTTDKIVTWSSNNTGVATVNSSGVITGVGAGAATITATTANKKTATVSVTVNPTARCSSINCSICSESECSINNCLWDASYKKCLKGDNSEASDVCRGTIGTVKKCVGSDIYTCISGSPQWNNGSPEKCNNGCKDGGCVILPETVVLSSKSVSLFSGESQQLSAVISPDNATDKTISWRSSNASLLTVAADGLIKVTDNEIMEKTLVMVTATTANKKTATVSVTVNPTLKCSSTNCDLCKKDECSTNNCLWNEGSQKCLKGDNSSAQQACKGKVSGKVCVNDYLYTCISGSPQWNNGSPEKCNNGCKDGGCVEEVVLLPKINDNPSARRPKISFKFSFDGVRPGAACLSNKNSLQMTVINLNTNGLQELTEVDFAPVKNTQGIGQTNSFGSQVFEVSDLSLETKFDQVNNNNVLRINNSVSLSKVMCIDNQTEQRSSDCNIDLTRIDDFVYRFAEYQVVLGDINKDKVIDSVDYSLIKSKLDEIDAVSCGKEGDLNMDGWVNQSDVDMVRNNIGQIGE